MNCNCKCLIPVLFLLVWNCQENNNLREKYQAKVIADFSGRGIAYSPYRDNESPHEGSVSREKDIIEDLTLLKKHFSYLRLYGSDNQSQAVLNVIKKQNFPFKVMLGIWVAPEEPLIVDGTTRVNSEQAAKNKINNKEQLKMAIRLAKDYGEFITAINVGNEIFVDWSWHRIDNKEQVFAVIDTLRREVKVPLTIADDYSFWNKKSSKAVAEKLDFLVVHAHPLWNGLLVEESVPWLQEKMTEVTTIHTDQLIIIGETGWATSRLRTGEEGRLMKDKANQENQQLFTEKYLEYINTSNTISFLFEAFDEKWKGGNKKDEAEKHWGLYFSDRMPKKAVQILK